ncbi:MAG: hypothetical protein IJL91_06900 [Bacteroidales bacterium]|nr:hypothetical protein [Bacteroidales bacterium]
MTVKELLRQFRVIDAEISDIRARYITEPELSDIFDREIEKLTLTRRRIEEYISDIPDSLIRYIFRKKYIDALTWDEISDQLAKEGKEGYSSDMLRKRHDRFMKTAPEV